MTHGTTSCPGATCTAVGVVTMGSRSGATGTAVGIDNLARLVSLPRSFGRTPFTAAKTGKNFDTRRWNTGVVVCTTFNPSAPVSCVAAPRAEATVTGTVAAAAGFFDLVFGSALGCGCAWACGFPEGWLPVAAAAKGAAFCLPNSASQMRFECEYSHASDVHAPRRKNLHANSFLSACVRS